MTEGTILYIGNDVPNKSAAGVRVFANALAIKEYGYDVVILSFDKKNNRETSYEKINDISVIRYPYPQTIVEWYKYLTGLSPYSDAIKANKNIKAVIAYEIPAVSFLRVRNYCHKNNIKIIADSTEWHTTTHLHGINKVIKMWDICATMRYAYLHADAIITVSSYLDNYFSRHGLQTIVVPPLYSCNSQVVSKRQNDGVKHLVYAGQIGADKDKLNVIIDALKDCRNYELNIYGIAKQEYISIYPEYDNVLQSIETLHEKICFHGFVPQGQVLAAVANSDFSVLIRDSSRRNNAGFPTKFGESIECGTPVIANVFSDVKSYMVKYGLGIVVEDMSALGEKLNEAIQMSDGELKRLKENCRNCRVFNYRNHIERLGDFITKIICS